MKQFSISYKGPLRTLAVLLAGGVISTSGAAMAAGKLIISPSTGLSNGQSVSVSGSGFAANATGSVVECNSDAKQPTVTVAGNQVPVSCTNPLQTLVNTDASGNLPAKPFTVHTGVIGPPASGTDSSGGNSATDAANYPCPPTAAQIAAGDSCIITFGDANGDDVSQNISFTTTSSTSSSGSGSSSTSSTSSGSSSPSTTSSSSSAPSSNTSSLTNTGPGSTIALFVGATMLFALARYAYLLRRSQD